MSCLYCFFYVGQSTAIELYPENQTASAGYFALEWDQTSSNSFVLQQSSDKTFSKVESVAIDGAGSITLSGFDSGLYYFRLSSPSGEMSNSVQVRVEHHSLQKAILFFITGLFMFLILIFCLWNGHVNQEGNH